MPADGRLLAHLRRCDHLALAAHRFQKIGDVRFHRLIVVARQADVLFFPLGDFRGRLAVELLRVEIQELAIQHLDGAFVAHELLAVSEVIVTEVATVVNVESIGVVVHRAQRIRHIAIVIRRPAVNPTRRRARQRHRLAAHEVGDVGLVHQQIGRDAARVVPVQAPLIEPVGIPRLFGCAFEESLPVGIGFARVGGNLVAPRRIVVQRIAIPERANIVHLADHSLCDHFLGLDVQRIAAILGAHLHHLAGLLRGLHHLESFFDGVRERFLDVDIFASLDRRHEHRIVQMFGSRNEHHVDRRIGQQLVIVGVGLGCVLADGLHAILGARQVPGVGIAHSYNCRRGGIAHIHALHQVIAAAARADPTDGDLVAGGHGALPG